MKTPYLPIVAIIFTTACLTTRTKYGPYTEQGGYSESQIDDRVSVVRFAGNAYTHLNDAHLFATFRAVEICREKGFPLTRILEVVDRTSQKAVQRTTNYTYTTPTNFSGTSNTTTNVFGQTAQSNTNLNGKVTGGNQFGQSQSWNDTLTFPTFDSFFSCTHQAYMMKVKMKSISAEDMRNMVKDLMGAVQVENVMTESPNRGILHAGDFVIKINNERVQNINQISAVVDGAENKENISVSIIRDGQTMTVIAKATDASSMIMEQNRKIISSACIVPEVKTRAACK